ncbi:ATP-binding protein [Denitrobaculum tricleocarpae]|uniref:histidine kinase n=1 Tax=Denitrobaculum tricleocarpae TaxID=2591009 RepID=A0A545SYR0_9PROT|nr:ATP-binding protein [Denitrobaculum tricleocarpae]TQV70069.1 PAS domain S-box protein [Denitrobaculum tricleocarpae]
MRFNRNLTVANKLRIAFVGIAFLSLVAVVAALISFAVIETAQEEVVGHALPEALNAQEIRIRAIELVFATSRLTQIESATDVEKRFRSIRQDAKQLGVLITDIESANGATATSAALRNSLQTLRASLEEQFEVTMRRLALDITLRTEFTKTRDLIDKILSALHPEAIGHSAALIEHGKALLSMLDTERRSTREAVAERLERLVNADIFVFQQLSEMQFKTEILGSYLDQLNSASDQDSVRKLHALFNPDFESVLRETIDSRDSQTRDVIATSIVELSKFTLGPDSLFDKKFEQIESSQTLARLSEESVRQSARISVLTDQLLSGAELSIESAATEARGVISSSRVVLIFVAVLSVAASTAATWFVVTRSITQRLKRLTAVTRRLARGELDVEVKDDAEDELGEMAHAISVFRENAIQLNASREELRMQQAEQRLIFDNVPARIWYKDDKNRILRLNRQAADAMGMSVEDVEGADTYELFPAMAAKYHEDDLRVIKSGKPMLGIVEKFTPKHGSEGWVRTDKVPYTDPETDARYILVAATDITPLKKAEQELERGLNELRQSNEQLQQFAYIASHDLQEPLRMVASYCDLLERRYSELLGEDGKEFIGYAVDGAKRMQHLINDILKYSRAGNQKLEFSEVQIANEVEAVCSDLKMLIDEKSVEVKTSDLPVVTGDRGQIRLVLQNLVHNAIKFNDKSAPIVEIGALDIGQFWKISVDDNGIGVNDQYAERIFDVFQRLHTREEYPGTGIGLAIVKRIVERHGGNVTLERKSSPGSCFAFTLPKINVA